MAFKQFTDYPVAGHETNSAPTSGLLPKKITNWAEYTPTFTGFGTVTKVKAYWRRQGPDILIRGQCLTGTTTATEARITLPNSLTSVSSYGATSGLGYEFCGHAVTEETSGDRCVLIEPSKDYVTFGKIGSSNNPTTKVQGSTLIGNSKTFMFECQIAVSGYEL